MRPDPITRGPDHIPAPDPIVDTFCITLKGQYWTGAGWSWAPVHATGYGDQATADRMLGVVREQYPEAQLAPWPRIK